MDDVFIYYVPLPTNIREFVTPCQDGYTIYINDSLTKEAQLSAYYHAMIHIIDQDFDKYDVQQIEALAHAVKK